MKFFAWAGFKELLGLSAWAILPILLVTNPVYGESTRPLAILVNETGLPLPALDQKLHQLEAEVWDVSAMDTVGREPLPTRWTVRKRDYPGTVLWLEGQSTLTQIPQQRPIWIISYGEGAQKILQLLPHIDRRIQFVAMVDLPPISAPISPSTTDKLTAKDMDSPTDKVALESDQSSPGGLGHVDLLFNYFQLALSPEVSATQTDRCDGVDCYEFDGRGDRPTAADWIESDLVFQLNRLVSTNPPEPITIILRQN